MAIESRASVMCVMAEREDENEKDCEDKRFQQLREAEVAFDKSAGIE